MLTSTKWFRIRSAKKESPQRVAPRRGYAKGSLCLPPKHPPGAQVFECIIPHLEQKKKPADSARPGCVGCLLPQGVNVNPVPRTYTIVMYTGM